MRTLLKGADILLRKENGYETLHGAYLGVDEAKIDYIGEEKPEKAYDLEKDMSGRLLAPGLINCHSHIAMTLMRGIGSGLPLQDWLATDAALRSPHADRERINIPAAPRYYWRYRMHLTLEELLRQEPFNATLREMIIAGGRR
mgnify:CR=1 FL=1